MTRRPPSWSPSVRAGFTFERADDIVNVPAAAVYAGLDRVPITTELTETQLADLLNDDA